MELTSQNQGFEKWNSPHRTRVLRNGTHLTEPCFVRSSVEPRKANAPQFQKVANQFVAQLGCCPEQGGKTQFRIANRLGDRMRLSRDEHHEQRVAAQR